MVQTWGQEERGEHTCECGAVYKVTVHRFPMRDSDSFNCSVCGTQIAKWNSTEAPSYELVSKPDDGKSTSQ